MRVPNRVVADDTSQADHQEFVICGLTAVVLITRWNGQQILAKVSANVFRFWEEAPGRNVFARRAGLVAHVAGWLWHRELRLRSVLR